MKFCCCFCCTWERKLLILMCNYQTRYGACQSWINRTRRQKSVLGIFKFHRTFVVIFKSWIKQLLSPCSSSFWRCCPSLCRCLQMLSSSDLIQFTFLLLQQRQQQKVKISFLSLYTLPPSTMKHLSQLALPTGCSCNNKSLKVKTTTESDDRKFCWVRETLASKLNSFCWLDCTFKWFPTNSWLQLN